MHQSESEIEIPHYKDNGLLLLYFSRFRTKLQHLAQLFFLQEIVEFFHTNGSHFRVNELQAEGKRDSHTQKRKSQLYKNNSLFLNFILLKP